jgi:hypothetical protein
VATSQIRVEEVVEKVADKGDEPGGASTTVTTITAFLPSEIDDSRHRRYVVEQAEREQEELADDLMIALEVATRDAADSGDRISLDDFMKQEGFDPSQIRS